MKVKLERTLDEIKTLIPKTILDSSGSVFYSGRLAFSRPSRLYLLGLNPGGSPVCQASETVGWHCEKVLVREDDDWSAYRDESWLGRRPGTCRMQPRVLHLLQYLSLNPGAVPSSNLVFERTSSSAGLEGRLRDLADACWPFHQCVIDRLGIRIVVCFGRHAGDYVCERLGAFDLLDQFVERNNRGWKSKVYMSECGIRVVVASHPSRANWTKPTSDPSPMIARQFEATK